MMYWKYKCDCAEGNNLVAVLFTTDSRTLGKFPLHAAKHKQSPHTVTMSFCYFLTRMVRIFRPTNISALFQLSGASETA